MSEGASERENCGRCHVCHRLSPPEFAGMVVCPDCGNKRCPKATDHELACSGSNEPDQPGSIFGPHDPLPDHTPAPAPQPDLAGIITAIQEVIPGQLSAGQLLAVAARVADAVEHPAPQPAALQHDVGANRHFTGLRHAAAPQVADALAPRKLSGEPQNDADSDGRCANSASKLSGAQPADGERVLAGYSEAWIDLRAYVNGDRLVICGTPTTDLPDGDVRAHDCDRMGCPSTDHVLARFRLSAPPQRGEPVGWLLEYQAVPASPMRRVVSLDGDDMRAEFESQRKVGFRSSRLRPLYTEPSWIDALAAPPAEPADERVRARALATMTDEEQHALRWAREQVFQSVAAKYARTLAGFIDRAALRAPTEGREEER